MQVPHSVFLGLAGVGGEVPQTPWTNEILSPEAQEVELPQPPSCETSISCTLTLPSVYPSRDGSQLSHVRLLFRVKFTSHVRRTILYLYCSTLTARHLFLLG